MRNEERRYDEASQLCRAAEDLAERIGSLRRRLREGTPGGGASGSAEVERADEAAREALAHLRRYREKLIRGAEDELEGAAGAADGAAEEVSPG